MKFGEYLHSQLVPEWQHSYLDYDKLKGMIKELEEIHLQVPQNASKVTSLSIPRPTNAAGMPVQFKEELTQEQFYAVLEQEMRKIEQFTKKQVQEIRRVLREVEAKSNSMSSDELRQNSPITKALRQSVDDAGETFLKLEKFVNLNFTGFHKILKKHDRRLPNPCKAFYTSRLLNQSWVRGDYSDVIVMMSQVYSKLRGDAEIEATDDAKQNFVRSTRKYWVHTEDISTIKYTMLQHLPVFLQSTMAGETDSQLVNSVYLDNHAMELYHGRLDKTAGAIAIRFRWYGTGTPDLVFVERKTHRDSWTGEVSVKERFTIKSNQVPSLLNGTFDIQGELTKLRAKGKSEEAQEEWLELVSEITQAINSKQLVPTMRTQYMRTAFQIPFDATVRVSLDTNLCMITERVKETLEGERWFRDPFKAVPLDEITRFPHGVLEVKLQLEDESKVPEWVRDVLESGKLLEVHKFSKFIHGCAVLLPEDVRSVPYWIDDATLAESISQSGAGYLIAGDSEGANKYYSHLLPHDKDGKAKNAPPPPTAAASATAAVGAANGKGSHGPPQSPSMVAPPKDRVQPSEEEILHSSTISAAATMHLRRGSTGTAPLPDHDMEAAPPAEGIGHRWVCWESSEECCSWTSSWQATRMTVQKVEPKLFFANERTFISWMHMAVILSSISIGVLAFSAKQSQSQFLAVIMMPLSLGFIGYALRTYMWRSDRIKSRDSNRWDDPYGPLVLTTLLVLAMVIQLVLKVASFMDLSDGTTDMPPPPLPGPPPASEG